MDTRGPGQLICCGRIPAVRKKTSISRRPGADGWAPGRVTDRAAAAKTKNYQQLTAFGILGQLPISF